MTNYRFKFILTSAVLFILVLFHSASQVTAQTESFKTDYAVDYYLNEKDDNIATRVSFKIKINNLTPDHFVTKFSITFPKSFQLGNIKASDDFKAVIPEVKEEDGKSTITVTLSNPLVGLNTDNNIYLDFLQYNLFKVNGNVWEVMLPTVESKEGKGDYVITVHLPPNSGKKIAISKPLPTHVTLNEITWRNPENRTIYAVFGKQQNYDLQLRYHLQNPRVTRVYTDVTFPPDTLYQKVYVNSILPKPNDVFMDEDGNYLGRYYLNPKEDRTVYFNGNVELYTEPREELKEPMRKLFNTEKKYLLAPSTHWKLESGQLPQTGPDFSAIYKYAVDTLSYNYARLDSDLTRLGANQALSYPDQAVCTEYSDVFIAIAREKGIFAREMQGYGFSSDQNLRPLSVNSDILHSWIEYYDTAKQLWIPVDPTWEDTSGIDYFNSFDLNHIVFAIHGKKSDYPYPAGSYKTEDSTKDINIEATSDLFSEKKSLIFTTNPIQIPTLSKNSYSLKITVQNTGNSFVWNVPIKATSDRLTINPSLMNIDVLAPMQKKELAFEYVPDNKLTNTKARIMLTSNSEKLYEHEITVTSIYYTFMKYGLIGAGIILGLVVAIKLIKR